MGGPPQPASHPLPVACQRSDLIILQPGREELLACSGFKRLMIFQVTTVLLETTGKICIKMLIKICTAKSSCRSELDGIGICVKASSGVLSLLVFVVFAKLPVRMQKKTTPQPQISASGPKKPSSADSE